MNIKNKKTVSRSTRLLITIKNGRLLVSTNLPVRWVLILSGAIAAAMGSPSIAGAVVTLLRAGK